MSKKIVIVQIIFIVILATLFIGYMRSDNSPSHTYIVAPIQGATSTLSIVYNASEFPFINPAVQADLGKHYIVNFKILKEKLVSVQEKQKQKTFIYFAYLNNASWIGLNEKDFFTAASTIKVPLAMSIYKMSEEGKIRMSDIYTLTDLDIDDNFGELHKVGVDRSFTIEELVRIMLVYSDNTAMKALLNIVKNIGVQQPLAHVYGAMGWENTVNFGVTPTYIEINLKTLSNMFLSLYNGSYNNVTDSNIILKYLSQSTFNEQIVAGVPDGVRVTHKIGLNDEDKTYSDCGIIYAPNRPYLLCVGSVGVAKDLADMFIAQVSKVVYEYVINN